MPGACAHRIDKTSPARDELQAGVKQTGVKTVMKSLMKISYGPQFFLDPAFLDLAWKRREGFRGGVARLQRIENGFGGQHAALNGDVDALEPLRIQQAGRIANY